ncbi:hypothetical protein AAC387_Pa12g1138 [Persea americana]
MSPLDQQRSSLKSSLGGKSNISVLSFNNSPWVVEMDVFPTKFMIRFAIFIPLVLRSRCFFSHSQILCSFFLGTQVGLASAAFQVY